MSEIQDLLRAGEEAFANGDKDEALRCFRAATKQDPLCAEAWNDLGTLHYELRQYEEAEDALRQALRRDAESVDALANLGRLLVEGEREEEAQLLLTKLESIAPQDPGCQWLQQRLGSEEDRWALLVSRLLPEAVRLHVTGSGDARRALARQGFLMAQGAATADATVRCGKAALEVPSAIDATPGQPMILFRGEGLPEPPDGWTCRASFTWGGESGHGFADLRTEPGRPVCLGLYATGEGESTLDTPLADAMTALIIDPQREEGRMHRHLREAMTSLGISWRDVPEDVMHALRGAENAAEGAGELARRLSPTLTIVSRGTPQIEDVVRAVRGAGGAVLVLGGTKPIDVPGTDLLPWPARARQFPELLLSKLRAIAPALRRDNDVTARAMPLISVVVDGGDHDAIRATLRGLAQQALSPRLFEVILALGPQNEPFSTGDDDGWPFALGQVRATSASRASLRESARTICRAPLTVFMSAGLRPSSDALMSHLVAHAGEEGILGNTPIEGQKIVVGATEHMPALREDTLVDLMDRVHLLDVPLSPTSPDWIALCGEHFSAPTALMQELGGFDAESPGALDAFCLARRAVAAGAGVQREQRLRTLRTRPVGLEELLSRARDLGLALSQEYGRTKDASLLPGRREPVMTYWLLRRREDEQVWPQREASVTEFRARMGADPLAVRHDRQLGEALRSLYGTELQHGLLGCPEYVPLSAMPQSTLVTRPMAVVIPNLNGFPHVKNTIESLRAHTTGPTQIIVVDNGSTDGSRGWLGHQPDVDLIALSENAGAPSARNIGLRKARGETILFCDNDVVFTPGWRERMCAHLDRWPKTGLVGPMSDYVSGPQQTRERPLPGEGVDGFAERFMREHSGEHGYTWRLISFCVLVRKEVIDQIGGFDPTFDPWGFEDDDLSLRAGVAGWSLRIARDVFIRHVGSQTARTGKLDYSKILGENWEAFKAKWGLPSGLPYGAAYDGDALVQQSFDRARHHCAIGEDAIETAH